MSTDLDAPTHHTPDTPHALSPASELIRQTAQTLDDAYRIAKALVSTSFAPAHFRGKPEEGAAAILYGATIDMDALTALQNIYQIGGKPALYARAMVAVVLSHGHQIWTEHEEEGTVTVAGQRRGSESVERVTWTTDDAKRAGYTSNKKYQTDPRSMLYARASGDVARRIAPDALLGMSFNVEELSVDPISTDAASRPQAPTRSGSTRLAEAVTTISAPAIAPEPVEPDKWETTELHDDNSIVLISEKQSKLLHVLVNELGLTRDQKIKGIQSTTGRDIESSGDLTADEAGRVIDSLQSEIDKRGTPVQDEVPL